MSKETALTLNTNCLIGFTAKRGTAWHYRADLQTVDPITGHKGNHYRGAIPMDHVQRRLFNWEAVASPVFVGNPNDNDMLIPDPDTQAIVRSDNNKIFKYFTDSYAIHQFEETLLTRVSDLLDSDLSIGSAGLLKGGARAWVSVEVPETLSTPEGVDFRPNLLACSSHDGSLATTFKRVITAVVCDNTLTCALGEKGQVFKAKHTANSLSKISNAREALNIIYQDADAFQQEVRKLCSVKVSDQQWSQFLDAHVPMPEKEGRGHTMAVNKRETLTQLWNADPRVNPWKNTKFGVLQAGNTYFHHLNSVRGKADRGERNMMNALTDETAKNDQEIIRDLEKVLALA
jgi:phage/plasmid-like protein (TIGR03299 family)